MTRPEHELVVVAAGHPGFVEHEGRRAGDARPRPTSRESLQAEVQKGCQEEHLRADQADAGVRLRHLHERSKPVSLDHRVVVDERDVLAPRGADAEIAPARKAEVAAGLHDVDLREALAHEVHRAVGRAVVDDDDALAGGRLAQGQRRPEEALQIPPPVVVQGHDADGGMGPVTGRVPRRQGAGGGHRSSRTV